MWRQVVAHAKEQAAGSAGSPTDNGSPYEGAGSFRGGLSGYERNRLFVRAGDRFVEAGGPLGLDSDEDGRSVATIDADGDGDLDLVVLSLQALRLFRNETPLGRHFTRIRLRATKGEPHALGAVVKVTAGGHTQVDRVRLTAGFHTQHSPELHFGLGAAPRVEAVEVRWPSGAVQHLTDLPADRRLSIVEGAKEARTAEVPAWPAETHPASQTRFGLSVRGIDADGRRAPVGPGRPVPTVLNFWAPSCVPCAREMPRLAALARRRGAAVHIVGVSVEGDADAVRAFAARHGVDFPLLLATDEVVSAFFGGTREIPLPTTFVFDAQGRVRRAFRHEVTGPELEALLDETSRAVAPDDYWELASRLARGTGKARGLELMAEATTVHPSHVLTWRRYAELLRGGDDLKGARAALVTALKLDPADADTYADLAQVLSMSGSAVAARRAVERALAIEPANVRALTNAGVMHALAGDREAARRAFEAALAVDPYYAPAKNSLGALNRR